MKNNITQQGDTLVLLVCQIKPENKYILKTLSNLYCDIIIINNTDYQNLFDNSLMPG